MNRLNSDSNKGEELFGIFRRGAEFAGQLSVAAELGAHALDVTDDLQRLTESALELTADKTIKFSAIDGNKQPFVSCFRINEASLTKALLGDLREIQGQPGRFQANEDYSMTWFPGYYRDVYPISSRINGGVVGIDLVNSDIVVKRKGILGSAHSLFGERTWIRLLAPDGKTPLVKVDFPEQ